MGSTLLADGANPTPELHVLADPAVAAPPLWLLVRAPNGDSFTGVHLVDHHLADPVTAAASPMGMAPIAAAAEMNGTRVTMVAPATICEGSLPTAGAPAPAIDRIIASAPKGASFAVDGDLVFEVVDDCAAADDTRWSVVRYGAATAPTTVVEGAGAALDVRAIRLATGSTLVAVQLAGTVGTSWSVWEVGPDQPAREFATPCAGGESPSWFPLARRSPGGAVLTARCGSTLRVLTSRPDQAFESHDLDGRDGNPVDAAASGDLLVLTYFDGPAGHDVVEAIDLTTWRSAPLATGSVAQITFDRSALRVP